MMSSVELHNICKFFSSDESPVFSLNEINLSLAPQKIWGLIGPAASGKSVLLKIICGLLRVDQGKILIAGEDITLASEKELMRVRSKIGMLFQNNALFDFMTVLENVGFPLIRSGVPPQEAEPRAAERLRAVGLAGSEYKYPAELSGGMKKRVGIARASVAYPDMVIYDEPTAGLDPVTTSKIYDLLQTDHQHTKATMIVVSSDVEALRRFAPRLGMLYQGTLLYDGPTDEIEESNNPIVRQFIRGEIEGPL